mmetsp:Transcript_6853/g.17510  ORF Transcript_6853/g.17510 Transcript_6853/m.17510 type:complete len:306 (-) Transcript_6853:22-939(-)
MVHVPADCRRQRGAGPLRRPRRRRRGQLRGGAHAGRGRGSQAHQAGARGQLCNRPRCQLCRERASGAAPVLLVAPVRAGEVHAAGAGAGHFAAELRLLPQWHAALPGDDAVCRLARIAGRLCGSQRAGADSDLERGPQLRAQHRWQRCRLLRPAAHGLCRGAARRHAVRLLGHHPRAGQLQLPEAPSARRAALRNGCPRRRCPPGALLARGLGHFARLPQCPGHCSCHWCVGRHRRGGCSAHLCDDLRHVEVALRADRARHPATGAGEVRRQPPDAVQGPLSSAPAQLHPMLKFKGSSIAADPQH